jgi:FecR protein
MARSSVVQRRHAEIALTCLPSPWDVLIVTSYRLALALPLFLVLLSDAWAQAPATQAPPAAAPADQQAAPDEPIGNVATLTGTATITRDNAAMPLKLKDDIYLNDVVATAATSSLGITFNDATTFTLKANAQVTIDNYVYEDGGKNNSGIFDIAKGTVAFAAAAVAKTGNMQITTPTSELGIRGTTGVVEVPEGGAAATTASNIKLYPDADGRVGQIEVNDRQGRRLGALTQGASGLAIRGGLGGGVGGARFAAVPLTISPQQATRDQGFVRQLHATQTVGRQIVTEQRAFRRANPQYRNPARPQQPGQQNRPGRQQPGTTPNRQGQQPTTPSNRPGQQGAPKRQGQQQQPGAPKQPGAPGRQGQQQQPGAPQQAGAPARPGQPPAGAAPSGTAQPNALPRTPGGPPAPGAPAVGPRTGAAPVLPPGVARPGGLRPPALPKGKPPPGKKKR